MEIYQGTVCMNFGNQEPITWDCLRQNITRDVVKEFEKLINAPDNSEFNLWFEYDLFCQVNMWFVISIVNSLPINKKIFAVYSSHLDRTSKHFWNGYGLVNSADLRFCLANRTPLENVDLRLGQDLWMAYKTGNSEKLMGLSNNQTPAFPYLRDVVKAQVDRFPRDGTKGRPEKVLEDITENVSTNFGEVFKEFWRRESIYGFGDVQLKHLYDRVMKSR